MARGVELGNHTDASFPSVMDDLLVFLRSVKGGVADVSVDGGLQGLGLLEIPVGEGMAATELGEFGQFLDLQAPRLVIGEVEM